MFPEANLGGGKARYPARDFSAESLVVRSAAGDERHPVLKGI